MATILFIKKKMYEKGNYWGLVGPVSDYGLGILFYPHNHLWWANGCMYNLLLCLWQLHNNLLLRENTYLTVGFSMVYIPFVKSADPLRQNMRPFTHAFTRKGQCVGTGAQ